MLPGLSAPPGLAEPGEGPDDGAAAFAAGLVTGSGLREISQLFHLSKPKKPEAAAGAQPSAGRMLQGNMGDVDKILLMARAQQTLAGAGAPGGPGAAPPPLAPPMGLPAMPPPGMAPPMAPPMAGPPPGAAL